MTVCGFCKGRPVGNAATWVDGKPRPPAPCPRCGETNARVIGGRYELQELVAVFGPNGWECPRCASPTNSYGHHDCDCEAA